MRPDLTCDTLTWTEISYQTNIHKSLVFSTHMLEQQQLSDTR